MEQSEFLGLKFVICRLLWHMFLIKRVNYIIVLIPVHRYMYL